MTEYDYPLLRLRNLGFVTLPRSNVFFAAKIFISSPDVSSFLVFKVLKIWGVHVGQSLMILKLKMQC